MGVALGVGVGFGFPCGFGVGVGVGVGVGAEETMMVTSAVFVLVAPRESVTLSVAA